MPIEQVIAADCHGVPLPVVFWVPLRLPLLVPTEQIDFGAGLRDGHRGIALVFGNERRGVSQLLLEASDALFYLPMSGLTQSFNIGVALGMSLHAAIRSGAFPASGLPEDECIELMGRWLLRDVKGARTHLFHAGIEFADF